MNALTDTHHRPFRGAPRSRERGIAARSGPARCRSAGSHVNPVSRGRLLRGPAELISDVARAVPPRSRHVRHRGSRGRGPREEVSRFSSRPGTVGSERALSAARGRHSPECSGAKAPRPGPRPPRRDSRLHVSSSLPDDDVPYTIASGTDLLLPFGDGSVAAVASRMADLTRTAKPCTIRLRSSSTWRTGDSRWAGPGS